MVHALVGLGYTIRGGDRLRELQLTVAEANHVDRGQAPESTKMLVADEAAADQTDLHLALFGRIIGLPRIEAGAA